MRIIKIIILVVALILAFFTPETIPNAKIIRFAGIGVIMLLLMRLMSKIPSKKNEDETHI